VTSVFAADKWVVTSKRRSLSYMNPAWPPHAKFHNAQTILLGLGLGILTVILA
jgi:hypothetical protein